MFQKLVDAHREAAKAPALPQPSRTSSLQVRWPAVQNGTDRSGSALYRVRQRDER